MCLWFYVLSSVCPGPRVSVCISGSVLPGFYVPRTLCIISFMVPVLPGPYVSVVVCSQGSVFPGLIFLEPYLPNITCSQNPICLQFYVPSNLWMVVSRLPGPYVSRVYVLRALTWSPRVLCSHIPNRCVFRVLCSQDQRSQTPQSFFLGDDVPKAVCSQGPVFLHWNLIGTGPRCP